MRDRLIAWAGIRPGELGVVALSAFGAFLVMSFLVLARALREAAYLAEFDASTLPYVTGGVVVLGFPLAAAFSSVLQRVSARRATRWFTLALAVGVAATWPVLDRSPSAVVAFYLVTAAGTVLLTSGFWVVVSEMLVVREAKRLFGLISAGGTIGMLVTGLAVGSAVQRWEIAAIVPVLVLLLLASAALNEFVPAGRATLPSGDAPASVTAGARLILSDRHVATLTVVVLLVAALGTVVDFQFKEAAQRALGSDRELAAFFGAFYGWTGGLALVVQLVATTRVMQRAGVAWSIAVQPILILILSAGMFAAPGLLMATGLRGTDSTLKKSLFRSVVEFLWVPVSPSLRRRTKTLVDTTAENAGDGLGALLVFGLVTAGGISSRWLSLVAIGMCLMILWLARRMGVAYLATVRERLAAGDASLTLAGDSDGPRVSPQTLSRLDVTQLLSRMSRAEQLKDGRAGERPEENRHDPAGPPGEGGPRLNGVALAGDEELRAYLAGAEFGDDDVPALARLLARDGVRDVVVERLLDIGDEAGPALGRIVADESGDFVVRRRVAQVLGAIPGEAALTGLLEAVEANRFEVRYRAARALSRRRRAGWDDDQLPRTRTRVWEAIRSETARGRAVWELARLLDDNEADELSRGQAAARTELSLEHVFRLLGLVLDGDAIRAAWRGLSGGHPELGSLALEYLEQVLPEDIRERLWPFIGDLTAEQSRRAIRPIDDVVGELLDTGATLFAGTDRERLQSFLGIPPESSEPEDPEAPPSG